MTEQVDRNLVVLVDDNGAAIGVADKLAAHRAPGTLHLAFSVFLFDTDGRLLIQQRAADKYHFPLVWANSCCSHPRPGQELVAAAESRVAEELGLKIALRPVGSFVYQASDARSGLVEHEFDWVLVGELSDVPLPDPREVADVRLVSPAELAEAVATEVFAPWFEEAYAIALAARR